GVALAQAGQWEAARAKFERVVALRSAPRALFALATAQEKLGRFASAKKTYGAARVGAHWSGDGELERRAEAAIAAIEPHQSRIAIRLTGDVAGAQVTLDGGVVQATEQGVEVDPGDHFLVVSAAGRQTFEQRLHVAESGRQEVIVPLRPTANIDAADSSAHSG